MFKLYTPQAAERIIRRLSSRIGTLSKRYAIPAPVLQTILYQEMSSISISRSSISMTRS